MLSTVSNMTSALIMSRTAFPTSVYINNLGTTITNRNLIHDEIKRRLNSGNACYH
jgi:hypothetical protein